MDVVWSSGYRAAATLSAILYISISLSAPIGAGIDYEIAPDKANERPRETRAWSMRWWFPLALSCHARAPARSRIGATVGYLSDYIGRCSSPLVDTHTRTHHYCSSPRGDALHVHPVSCPGAASRHAARVFVAFTAPDEGASSNPLARSPTQPATHSPLSLFISISEPRVELFSLALAVALSPSCVSTACHATAPL